MKPVVKPAVEARTRPVSTEFHVCTECGKKFDTLQQLHGHSQMHSRKGSSTESYPCSKCERVFDNQRQWIGHQKAHSKKQHAKWTRNEQPKPSRMEEIPYPIGSRLAINCCPNCGHDIRAFNEFAVMAEEAAAQGRNLKVGLR